MDKINDIKYSKNWYLVTLDGDEKSFELFDTGKSEEHEKQIPFF